MKTKLAEEAIQCFCRVLSRRSIGAMVEEPSQGKKFLAGRFVKCSTSFLFQEEKFSMNVLTGPRKISINVFFNGKKFFHEDFDLKTKYSLRVSALILAKKLKNKSVHDVLKS